MWVSGSYQADSIHLHASQVIDNGNFMACINLTYDSQTKCDVHGGFVTCYMIKFFDLCVALHVVLDYYNAQYSETDANILVNINLVYTFLVRVPHCTERNCFN